MAQTNTQGPARRSGDPVDDLRYLVGFLILVALGIAAVIAVPALCGMVIFFALRRWLARRDWVIVTLSGLVGFACYLPDNTVSYGRWLLGLVQVGTVPPDQVPVTSVLCLTAVLAGIMGIGFTSSVRIRIPHWWSQRIRKRVTHDPLTPKPARRAFLRHQTRRRVKIRDIPAVRGPYASGRVRRTPLSERSMPLGLGSQGGRVKLSVRELGMHGCVVGSTGSGKTVTLMWIIGAALDMGYDVTMIDLKEDTEPGGLRDFLRGYSGLNKVPLQEIALADEHPTYWFNVLADMTADEAFDTIMSLVEFDDAHWQALNRKILQQVIQLCYQASQVAPAQFGPPTMLEIGKILEHGQQMKQAVKSRVMAIDEALGTGYCKERYTNVLSPSSDEAKSGASFGTKLTGLYDSTAGRRMLVPGGGRRMIDVRLAGITYIGLNSLGQPDMAKIVSSSALQRLSVYAAQRIQGRAPKDRPRLIVVDEASNISRPVAMNMLARVRSALFSMILCTQGPTDWIDKTGDDWARISQNINWLIAMSQSSPESAEKCAEFLGMRENNIVKQQVLDNVPTENSTISTTEEFIVTPKELRGLSTGEGFLRVNKPESRVAYVTIPMRDRELQWLAKY